MEPTPLEQIEARQRAWAQSRGIPVDASGRVPSVEHNLLRPLRVETRTEFRETAPTELGDRQTAGDLQLLRSTRALVCNVFDYWRGCNLQHLAHAVGADPKVRELHFVRPFPTGQPSTPPLADVLLTGPSARPCAVLARYAEVYQGPRNAFDASTFAAPDLWAGIPRARDVAESIARGGLGFRHLAAAHLLRLALGLKREYGPGGFRLIYFWVAADGLPSLAHHTEIDELLAHLLGDVEVVPVTLQQTVDLLSPHREHHAEYLAYLERYLGTVFSS